MNPRGTGLLRNIMQQSAHLYALQVCLDTLNQVSLKDGAEWAVFHHRTCISVPLSAVVYSLLLILDCSVSGGTKPIK